MANVIKRSKNILIAGPAFYGYSAQIGKAFSQAQHNVTLVTYDPFHTFYGTRVRYRDIPVVGQRYEEALMSTYWHNILEAVKNTAFDLILFIRPDRLARSFMRKLRERSKQALVCAWCMDPLQRYPIKDGVLESLDAVFLYDKNDVDNESLIATPSYSLPMGFDAEYFFPIKRAKRYTVSFIGALNKSRGEILGRVFQSFNLVPDEFWVSVGSRQTLKGLVRQLATRWRRPGNIPVYRRQDCNGRMACKIYQESLVCLNIHQKGGVSGFNPRLFEIAGAGGAQICDALPGIEGMFEPGSEIFVYKTPEQLEQQLEWLLKNPKLREKVAEKAAKRAHASHTFAHRISTMESILF